MSDSLDPCIRRARGSDAAALIAILYATFTSTWLPQLTSEAAKSYEAEDRPGTYVGARGLAFWVAELGDEIVGLVDVEANFVNALHVSPSHARRGIGRRLMDRAEAEIMAAGFATVELETDTFNSQSRAFYAARGYREVDRYPDEEWNSGLMTVRMEKTLDQMTSH
jgi:GNAT superfamily N-acetyltransferase